MISHSPSCKNFVGRPTDAITVLPGRCHARHSRQVSHTGLINASRGSSTPAAWMIFRISLSDACDQRRWSFRSSFCMTTGSNDLKLRMEIWTLKRVQSGRLDGPEPVSANERLARESTLPCSSEDALPGSGGASPRPPGSSSYCWASRALASAEG